MTPNRTKPSAYHVMRVAHPRQSLMSSSSSKSAAPNRRASKRRTISSPRAARVITLLNEKVILSAALRLRGRAQNREERFLRDLDAAHALHPRLAFLLHR